MKNIIKIFLILVLIASIEVYAESSTTINTTPKHGYYINKNFDLIPNDKNGNKKVVLITIDDGPGKTDKDLVSILNKHKAKAIFFINGTHDKENKGNIKMLYENGYSIGNHTWDHLNLKKEKSNAKIIKEIDSTTNLIKNSTGSSPRFFRPPYGAINKSVKDLIKKDNMIFMNWSGSAKDWEKSARDEKVFLKNVEADLHDGEIILLHGHPWTAKYLDTLLTMLENKGYTFVNPSEITN